MSVGDTDATTSEADNVISQTVWRKVTPSDVTVDEDSDLLLLSALTVIRVGEQALGLRNRPNCFTQLLAG